MTTNTEIKPGTEITIDDGDMLICVTDGYGRLSILRYPLPKNQKLIWCDGDRKIGDYQAILINKLKYGTNMLHVFGLVISVSVEIGTAIAEALYGGPLPDAPHNCSVSGCNHGDAA